MLLIADRVSSHGSGWQNTNHESAQVTEPWLPSDSVSLIWEMLIWQSQVYKRND